MEDVNVTPKQEPLDIPLKKTKLDESPLRYLTDLYNPLFLYQFSQLSRQQPWLSATSPKHIISPFGQNLAPIPYLPTSQEPPVLQNPERVVRHTESERFERSYQPNVALAPRQSVLTKERDRDFDKDRDINERSSSVIKCEIQIKQERPSTPNNESPELRNSPETTGVMETNGVSSAAPISPEGQSGSNEITSSTSPVPVNIPKKQESMSPPPSSQTSPSLTSPRSHLLSHTILKTSPVVVKVTTNQPSTLMSNGIKKVPILGNPEFELSTDTDEESVGEPDSSNLNGSSQHAQTPYEFAKLLLKNNSLEDQDKVLNLIKYMDKEITQLKEHHKKEMRELQQQQQQRNEGFRKTIENLQNQFNQQNNRSQSNMNSSSVIATSCLSSSSSSSSSSLSSSSSYDYDRTERRNSIVEKPNVIIKPLKKSLRITPLLDDCKSTANVTSLASTPSIVIMPKREDIMNNNNTKIYNNNNNAAIVNGQTESLDDTLKKTTIKAEKL